jgi:dTDP-4-amino-4,6-dideoxygalactose transaminase
MLGIEERNAVLRVMDRGILSGYQGNWSEAFYGGEEVRALEKEWADYFGVKHAIAVNSATSGLWAACAAIGLQQNFESINDRLDYFINGDEFIPHEVIVTPYSMTCSASIPLHFGAKPVFADIERDYYCLAPDSVEKAITERTKTIIAVDLFGQPYAADEINAIARAHGLYVIEDAAQAIGAKYKGRYAGTLGDIGVYSLNVHKHIQCGEGGIVVTDNDKLAFKIRLAMNHSEAVINSMAGYMIPNNEDTPLKAFAEAQALAGLNLRMTELQAAIARGQLKKLPGILEKVRSYARYFPVRVRPECGHSFYRYAWDWRDKQVTDELWYQPDSLLNFKHHYITPIYQMPLFQSLGYDQHQCPVCEEVESNIVLVWLKEV